MKKDPRKSISSGLEIQSNELNEEQLDEVTGGLTIRMLGSGGSRQCAANPSHRYAARNANDVCPFCGAKGFIDLVRN